jgi:hypothetical protein
MGLAGLRRSSRLIAAVLLASFTGLSHFAGDDACAVELLQAHDESQHAVGVPEGSAPDHCAVCHSVRSPRRPHGPVAHPQSPLRQGVVIDAADAASRRAPALDRLPARAPPSR